MSESIWGFLRMVLRALTRSAATLLATGVVAALLSVPATAAVCADCMDPDLPGPGGPQCPSIAATEDPKITSAGTPQVNGKITATTGVWNSNTKKLRVMWFAAGSAVPNTTQNFSTTTKRTIELTPPANLRTKRVRLYVRGLGADEQNCGTTEYSHETAAVAWGQAPQNTGTSANISGNLKVGETLQAYPGTWNMPVDSFVHTWRWSTGEHRGTGPSYTLTAADAGKLIRLDVEALRDGHLPGTASRTTTTPVAAGDALVSTTAPAVTGELVYGAVLSVDDGQWAPAAEAVTRQWLRDGTAVDGATGPTYELGLDDVGAQVSVVLTASRAGYGTGSTTVEAGTVRKAAAPRWSGKKVALKGKDKVGKKVRVAMGLKALRTRAGAPGAQVTYQWLRAGKPVKGATKRVHVIKKVDRKKKLKVRITISRPGHQKLVMTTKAVKIRNKGRKLG